MSRPTSPVLTPRSVIALAAQLACLMAGESAMAQAAAPAASAASTPESTTNTLETVIVTARKREERGQDVPQSLNVFSGAALEASGVADVQQLQFVVPGLSTTGTASGKLAIRGISNNASSNGGGPSTAVHFDGVYLPRPAMAFGQEFDLTRVEILKGPEGTLYGRNATAGVINFLSRDPGGTTGFDGFIGGGSFGLVRAQAGVNIGAGESASFRISAASVKDDGYTKNLNAAGGKIDAQDFQAVRLKGLFAITKDVEAKVTVQFVDDKGTVGYGISGIPTTANFVNSLNPPQRQDARHIQMDTPPEVRKRGALVSAQVSAELGNGIQLKSITGYVRYNAHDLFDADGSGGFIENSQSTDRSNFWSQEFQLSGGSASSLAWTTGLYYSRERTSGSNLVQDSNNYPTDLTPFTFSTESFSAVSRAAAVFGEVTYPITKDLFVTAGARYTSEKISGDSSGSFINFSDFSQTPFAGAESTTSSRFTPKLLLQYKPNDQQMVYASVTNGFKSGGINFFPPIKTYRPETVSAYEIGTKNQFLNGTLEADLGAFYYDYKDLQLRTVVGKTAPISNASKASIKGVEAALVTRPVRGLTFDLNAAYMETELKDYISPATKTDLSGMPLPLAPRFSGTAGAQYRWAIANGSSLTARAEVNHQSSIIFPALQDPSRETRGSLTLINANLRFQFPDKRTYLSLIGRNLANKTYLTYRNYSAGFADFESYGPPRSVEARIGTSF